MDKSQRFPLLAKLYRGAMVRYARLTKGIDPDKAVFCCLQGRFYGDSPRCISERLHERRPNTKIVWMLNSETRQRVKDSGLLTINSR